jgi:phage N-6-adenine-methyltransferase
MSAAARETKIPGNNVSTSEASSASDSWATPPELFAALSALYGPFDLDAAADANNAKCASFLSEQDNALQCGWGGWRVWCNPPYSRGNKPAFFAKAREEMEWTNGPKVISLLVPHNTAEGWWTEHVDTHGPIIATKCVQSLLGKRTIVHTADLVIEVLALRGRVRFVETTGAPYKQATAPFSSAVVTFSRPGVLYPVEAPTRPRGRPTVITAEARENIERLIRYGHSAANACRLTGINRRTWVRFQTLNRRKAAP